MDNISNKKNNNKKSNNIIDPRLDYIEEILEKSFKKKKTRVLVRKSK